MKPASFRENAARRAWQVLACAAALAVVGCDNDVNFNPTVPSFPFTPTTSDSIGEPGRNLEIAASLTAEGGYCLEATILYDGEEVEGARIACSQASGCAVLGLTARLQSDTGRHTISFQVLRQSAETVAYSAGGTVTVSRPGVPLVSLILPLGPVRINLRAGENVTFDIEFSN